MPGPSNRIGAGAAERLHTGAMAAWGATVVVVGGVAAISFPILKYFEMELPEYPAYPDEPGILAAGVLMIFVFHISNFVQIAWLALAGVTLVLVARRDPPRRAWLIARVACFILLLGATTAWLGYFWPTMNDAHTRAVNASWHETADGEAAQAALDEFRANHKPASNTLVAIAALALTGAALAAASPRDGAGA